MQAVEQLRGHGVDPVDDGCGTVVGAPRLPLLLVGEGEDAQGEDLVDLGGVEHVPLALGGDLGVVVQGDRRGQDDLAVALVADQHRPRPHVLARGHRTGGELRRVDEGHEPAVVGGHQRVHRGQRAADHVVPGRAVPRRPGREVLDHHPELDQGVGALDPLGGQPQPPGEGQQATDDPPRLAQRLDLFVGRQLEGDDLLAQAHRLDVQLLLDRLVERAPQLSVDLERAHGRARRVLDGPGLDAQEAELEVDDGTGALDQHLGLHERALARVVVAELLGGGNAELPADLVLGRRGPVRVQDVALVQDGVGHLAGTIEAGGGRAG